MVLEVPYIYFCLLSDIKISHFTKWGVQTATGLTIRIPVVQSKYLALVS